MMVDSTIRDPEYESLPLQQRVKAPLIWARLSCGIRIEDLQENRYEEAIDLLREHYVREETLCRASNLADDPESLDGFFEITRMWMRDLMSLVAIQEGTRKVVGILLNRVNEELEHTRTFSRIQFTKGEAFHKVMELRCHVHKQFDVFEHYDVTSFLRIYAICVHRHFRDKGIGMGLLKCSLDLARLTGQTVAMGIFTSAQSQRMARKLGMTTHLQLNYDQWMKNKQVIFKDTGAGNDSIMLMAMKIPNVPEITFTSEEMQKVPKARTAPISKQKQSQKSLQKVSSQQRSTNLTGSSKIK